MSEILIFIISYLSIGLVTTLALDWWYKANQTKTDISVHLATIGLWPLILLALSIIWVVDKIYDDKGN